MTTITAAEAQNKIAQLIMESQTCHDPVRVTSAAGSAVLMSETDYESIMETISLLEEPGFKESLAAAEKEISLGKTQSFEEVFGEPVE